MGDVAPEVTVTRGWLIRGVEALLKQTHAKFLAKALDIKLPWAKGHLLWQEYNHCEGNQQSDTSD